MNPAAAVEPPTPPLPWRPPLRSRQLVWAALLLALAMAALACVFVAFEWREIRKNQLARAELYARALDDQTTAVVAATDGILRSLQAVAEQPASRGDMAAIAALLADSLRGRPFLRSVSWLGADGRVLASSNDGNRGLAVPMPLLGPGNTLLRSARLAPLAGGRDIADLGQQPLATSRVHVLPMVLPITTGSGTVYLLALINPDHLATQFDRTVDGQPLRALLLGLDGQLLAATSNVPAAPGQSMATLSAFTQHLPAREFASGSATGSDGEPVLSAFRVTRHWPLVVMVEQAQSVLLRDVAAIARWAGGFMLTGWLVLGLGTVAVRRTLLHDEQLNHDLARAHAATQASESRKLAILQSSLDAIVTVDPQGHIIEFNAAAETMFGHRAAAVLGQPMHQLIVPAHHRQAHQEGMARYQSTGVARVLNRRVEVEALRADGSLFPVELTIVPVKTAGGEIFTATLRDITERQRVESALRDSEARSRATFDQAAVGVLSQGPDGRMLRVNQTLCELLGYTRQELLALPADELLHPDDAPRGVAGMRALFAGELPTFAQDLRYRRKDGRGIWVRLTASLMRDDQGRPMHLIGIVEDISARRQAEAELAAARLRELQVGARIQQSLLVTLPPNDLPGVHFSSYSQASQGIDGDFVEIIRVGPHCVDLIAGDVMGKGLAAAMMGAATKLQFSRSMAELVTQRGQGDALPRPAEVVAAVHRAMTPALQDLEAFVTLCYVRIDAAAGRITWVGCGHEETLHVTAAGASTLLDNQHPPLGVLDAADYQEDSRDMAPGDALFLCSDGVTDALRPNGERVGRDRVIEAATRLLQEHHSPGAVLHTLRRDLLPSGVRMQDDVTMVVVQRQPAGHCTARVELPLDLQAVRQVRNFVNTRTAAYGLDEAAGGLLEVACVEAFTNIVRHGRGLMGGAPVELLAHHSADALVIELVHLGAPYRPPADMPETDFGTFPEGGFGLRIIHGASDDVEYLHHGGVNTVRMTKRLHPQSAPQSQHSA